MWTSRTFVTLWCNNKFILIHGFDELSENHIFMTKSFQQLNVHTFVSFPSVLICTYIIISIPLNFQLRHKHVLFIRLNFIQSNCFFFHPATIIPSILSCSRPWLLLPLSDSSPEFVNLLHISHCFAAQIVLFINSETFKYLACFVSTY